MLDEVIRGLDIKANGIYLDCTFGRGGHSLKILQHLDKTGFLLAFDRDIAALKSEQALFLLQDDRFNLEHSCFSNLEKIVNKRNWKGGVDGVLLDLGVSSPQLDDPDRGFSFIHDGPLDMRMDTNAGISAAQWLAVTKENEIARVLYTYGEEKFSRRIAAAIVKDRRKQPFLTTLELANLIERVVPMREKFKHPATRSFQAIRIEINKELEELQETLEQSIKVLKPGGRLVTIAFHSLEDRIIKRLIRDESRGKYEPSKHPIIALKSKLLRLKKIGKAMRASATEVKHNIRARSAVMRVAERASKNLC